MDVIGHAFSGALIGIALEPGPFLRDPAKPRARWPLFGALAATFPDIDAVSYLAGAEAFARHHQIYTHNIIALFVLPPILGFALRNKLGDPARAIALFWLGMSAHLLGDTIATWPLRFLLPFSDRGFAFHLIARDFSIGLALIYVVATALCLLDQLLPWRRPLAIFGLLAGIALVLSGYG